MRGPRSGPSQYRHPAPSLAYFYSAPLAWNPTGVDTPLRDALQALWPLRPLVDVSAIAPLYHPATWLVATGLAAVFAAGRQGAFRAVFGDVMRLGTKPVLVTVVYVVLARLVAAGGLAEALAGEAEALAGAGAIYLAPLFGALSGFLTGSNTASNAMMMPVQAALARAADANVVWTAAVQNVAGSTLTMLSPTRIATGCALLGLVGQDRAAYAKVWVFGVAALAILLVCWGSILLT